MLLDQALAALAGLGFFLAGLHLLSEVVRSLATRQVRHALARLARVPFSAPLAGSLLGAVTQSTSAASFVCMGLLSSRSISFSYALVISSWTGAGTSLLVFLASVDLKLAALFALSVVAIFYLASLHRSDAGRRATELLLAIGVTFLGLAMVKDAGHVLEPNVWTREFFAFAAGSWVYGFLIGLVVTLVLQSSSTVSILVVAMSAARLISLEDAIVLVCGASLGSGLAIALVSSHLTGPPRQLAIWQAIVKGLGSAAILFPTLTLFAFGTLGEGLQASLPVPTLIALAYLVLNIAGAVLAGMFRRPLTRFIQIIAPEDPDRQLFEPAYIIDEAADDPDTALLLASREQARLSSLLPTALAPLRPEEDDAAPALPNEHRRELAKRLLGQIEGFISEAVERHPKNADLTRLLVLQRCNDHLVSLIDALHDYVVELSSLQDPDEQEVTIVGSMTESLHLLLSLLADQTSGASDDADSLMRLTNDHNDIMNRYRNKIATTETSSNANRERLFVATGLFERVVWLVRKISTDTR